MLGGVGDGDEGESGEDEIVDAEAGVEEGLAELRDEGKGESDEDGDDGEGKDAGGFLLVGLGFFGEF